ncbi:hypothetical protein [Mesorhizobium sp.]|uniref:hypothetical protein n=1 Tax=Mesorhizobium sp. TaxID=1871066 RepID=UPI0012204F82|nr:hypothetical protein [Mesorhizobium sp.]TIS87704.1 MAG: hypothetical protein E5W89_24025 [Mesorhizobium sp.]
MTSLTYQTNDVLEAALCRAQSNAFLPRGTVRCQGPPAFRTQLARDLGCLLDVDGEVDTWSCLPAALGPVEDTHIPDFLVRRGRRHTLVDAGPGPGHPWLDRVARERGCDYEAWPKPAFREGFRLSNAKDLLRYARWECPLGDRIRLLGALDEAGSLSLGECLSAFRETRPMAGLASLVLQRFIEVELDEARIGPETAVRRRD